jgi:hypothetical protein
MTMGSEGFDGLSAILALFKLAIKRPCFVSINYPITAIKRHEGLAGRKKLEEEL